MSIPRKSGEPKLSAFSLWLELEIDFSAELGGAHGSGRRDNFETTGAVRIAARVLEVGVVEHVIAFETELDDPYSIVLAVAEVLRDLHVGIVDSGAAVLIAADVPEDAIRKVVLFRKACACVRSTRLKDGAVEEPAFGRAIDVMRIGHFERRNLIGDVGARVVELVR